MAARDMERISEELARRFALPVADFYERRVIFWYDSAGEFAEKLEELALPGVKLLVLTGRNDFEAKRLLAEDRESSYLVYDPRPEAGTEADWLLPVELFSEAFRADLVSLWMQELDLPMTPAMASLVKGYRAFFQAKERRQAFMKVGSDATRPGEVHLSVMAALAGAESREPACVLRAVLSDALGDAPKGAYEKLVRYGADVAFWKLAAQAAGYEEETPSLPHLMTHLLLSAASRTLHPEYLSDFNSLYSSVHQGWCYDFISEWIGQHKNDALLRALRDTEEKLGLFEKFRKVPLDGLLETDIFPCIDECILQKLMGDAANHIIDSKVIASAVERRRTTAWYEDVACYYECLYELAKMEDFYHAHAGDFHQVRAQEVWRSYTDTYFQMDRYYRIYHKHFARCLLENRRRLDTAAKQVNEVVEGLYSHWFLEELGRNWTDAAADELAADGKIQGLPQQTEFYRKYVAPAGGRVYVIISDALRYEVAASLAEALKQETQCQVSLSSCEGIFPTVTKFGMAALLPHDRLSVEEKGELSVLADDRPTGAGSREKVLRAERPASAAFKYDDLVAMKRGDRKALVKDRQVVYIYHDKIDQTSHSSDREVFTACDDAIEEIRTLVRMIRNDFGGTNIFITADHGFLYTWQELSDDEKVDKTTAGEEDVEVDRRYLITRKGARPAHLLPVRFLDDRYDAFAARGYLRIKKKGGGLHFVHGGMSLQEMVVPVIEYHYLRNDSMTYLRNKEKYDTRPVELTLLSSARKVSNTDFSLDFYQKDSVSANRSAAVYTLRFVDTQGRAVSDTVKVIADKDSVQGQERTFHCHFHLKPLKYDSRAVYHLVIATEGLPVKKEEFQFDIAFDAEEFDFFG